jgi:three-Cys-motif partner protein
MEQKPIQQFGGAWTTEKLERIRKYLKAYLQVMKNQYYFRTHYVDAFAGTGYNTIKNDKELFPDLVAPDTQQFLDGSARIALKLERPFDRYIFIEKSTKRSTELEKLKSDFPQRQQDITLVRDDANQYITSFCRRMDKNDRAVLFLDPFGMQVPWSTVEIIAQTQKIDLWYLFPMGMGVMRMLKNDADISETWRKKLTELFGTQDWYQSFYPASQLSLFEESDTKMIKQASEASVKSFIVDRLKSAFPGVAKNPLVLRNSKNSPLYLLCFAASNEKGKTIAIKIAENILKPPKI